MMDQFHPGAVQLVVGEATYGIPLADIIDLDQERARLQKEIDKLAGEIERLEKKLANENFVAKAPPEVVEEQKERREEAQTARSRLAEALDRIAVG
jgi:valyl-tRNA synthetase